jgi:hypothetical protein
MDNCPSHLTSDVRDILNTSGVTVLTFAPHTTQIFQLLDLTLFGMFKQEGKYHLPFSDLGTTINFAYNVYLKMAKRLTSQNIWAAFQAIGSTFNMESMPCHIVFHQEKLGESKGFIKSGTLIIHCNLRRLDDKMPNSAGSTN